MTFQIPKSSKLHYNTVSGTRLAYPNVSVRNVYMFPGIPELLKQTVTQVGPLLFQSGRRYFTQCFYCNLPEHKIAMELQQVVDEFPEVQFGCYPKLCHRWERCRRCCKLFLTMFFSVSSVYKVKVTVESHSEEITLKAFSRLMALLPPNSIVDFEDT